MKHPCYELVLISRDDTARATPQKLGMLGLEKGQQKEFIGRFLPEHLRFSPIASLFSANKIIKA
jgi:hypothetical protein